MLVEADVLRGHQCLHERRCQLGIVDEDTVFTVIVPCAHHLTVSRDNLRSKAVDRILQVFDGRHIAYPALINGIESE